MNQLNETNWKSQVWRVGKESRKKKKKPNIQKNNLRVLLTQKECKWAPE